MTPEEIYADVKRIIAEFVNMKPSSIKDNYILQNPPLQISTTKLNSLAVTLRSYIKAINMEKTITATEVKKKDLTVKKLGELVNTKLA